MSGRNENNVVMLPVRRSRRGEAPWEIVDMLPRQGEWSVEAYRNLPTDGPLVELNNGCLEVLAMPEWVHQAIAFVLAKLLERVEIDGRYGIVVLPPFNLHTIGKQYRHPDVMFLLPANRHRFRESHWDYADLVVEILGASDPDRDLVDKRAEYAKAGIPEYWVIDPVGQTLLLLALDGDAYRAVGTFGLADRVRSATIPGLELDFGKLIADAQPPTV